MAGAIDYSQFDGIGDTSDEEEEFTTATAIRDASVSFVRSRQQELTNMTTMHDASNAILSMIRVLPREPTDTEYYQFTMQFAGVHFMSASDQAQLLDEVCEATQQLVAFREKLVVPMGTNARNAASGLICWLLNGSKRTIRAMICIEMLNFFRWLLQESCRLNDWVTSGQALMIMHDSSEADPKTFEKVFLNASPVEFIAKLAMFLPDGAAADVSPASFTYQALRLIRNIMGLFRGDAREIVLKTCCEHIWPVVVNLLLLQEIPDSWLVDDVPFCERGLRGAARDARPTFPSFLAVLLFTVRCFHSVKMAHTLDSRGRNNIHSDHPNVYFSEDLFHRLNDLAKAQHLPEEIRSLSLEAIAMCISKSTRKGKPFRGACQAHDDERIQNLLAIRKDEVLEYSICGRAGCGAQETTHVKFQKCSGCLLQRYCSRECQKKAWRQHKAHCTSRATIA